MRMIYHFCISYSCDAMSLKYIIRTCCGLHLSVCRIRRRKANNNVGWMDGWIVGLLAGWLAGWQFGWWNKRREREQCWDIIKWRRRREPAEAKELKSRVEFLWRKVWEQKYKIVWSKLKLLEISFQEKSWRVFFLLLNTFFYNTYISVVVYVHQFNSCRSRRIAHYIVQPISFLFHKHYEWLISLSSL